MILNHKFWADNKRQKEFKYFYTIEKSIQTRGIYLMESLPFTLGKYRHRC